jgi:hypothetical protein
MLTAASVVVCAALMTAVTLIPAPIAVVPLAMLICIACPLAMAWSLPRSIAVLRATRAPRAPDEPEVRKLRSHLARLPETEHPLGL